MADGGECKFQDDEELLEEIHELFSEQKLAVLSTEYDGQAYSSLLAFAATEDLQTLVFATEKSTRKYANITANPLVSLLVDNRCNTEKDFYEAVSVTAMGEAREAFGEGWEELKKAYVEKHPSLKEFVESDKTALVGVDVETYVFVQGFKCVSSIEF